MRNAKSETARKARLISSRKYFQVQVVCHVPRRLTGLINFSELIHTPIFLSYPRLWLVQCIWRNDSEQTHCVISLTFLPHLLPALETDSFHKQKALLSLPLRRVRKWTEISCYLVERLKRERERSSPCCEGEVKAEKMRQLRALYKQVSTAAHDHPTF